MDILYIVIPAYNEEAGIARLISDWYPVVEQHDGGGESRLVVINDGSRDQTYEKLLELAKDRPLLQPLTKPNGGHGPTLLYGYRYALEHGADFVFQTDSDGQTDAGEFEAFWKRRKRYEAIFGMRFTRGDGFMRAAVEQTLCKILRAIFHVRIPDANAPFRLMTSGYLGRYIERMAPDYNLPNVMLVVFGIYEQRRVRFMEISFKARQSGVNSINVRKITKIGVNAIREFKQFKREMD